MKFRLETLLKIRKSQEELLQKDFAVANRHYLNQQNRLRFMEETEDAVRKDVDARLAAGLPVDALPLYDQFFDGVRRQEQLQKKIVEESFAKAEVRRAALTEGMRKRKTLEMLKERQWLAWRKEQEKRETAWLDEASSNLWIRKSGT